MEPNLVTFLILILPLRPLTLLLLVVVMLTPTPQDGMREMELLGLEPNLVTYELLIRARARAGDVAGVRRAVGDLLAAGLRPTEATWASVMRAYAAAGELEVCGHALRCAVLCCACVICCAACTVQVCCVGRGPERQPGGVLLSRVGCLSG